MTIVFINYYNINKLCTLPHTVFYLFYMIITTNKAYDTTQRYTNRLFFALDTVSVLCEVGTEVYIQFRRTRVFRVLLRFNWFLKERSRTKSWNYTAVFLNRRAAARYRVLASIILGSERPEETTICYKISLV